jgi:hypothetical protein
MKKIKQPFEDFQILYNVIQKCLNLAIARYTRDLMRKYSSTSRAESFFLKIVTIRQLILKM